MMRNIYFLLFLHGNTCCKDLLDAPRRSAFKGYVLFGLVEILRPSQFSGVMSSAVRFSDCTFSGHA